MKCDKCRKKATANYQKTWVKYPIDKSGDYGEPETRFEIEEPIGENNLHLCNDCAEKFEAGEI